MSVDIIRDIIDRVSDRLGLPDEMRDMLGLIERDVRRDWGGDRPYIAKAGESVKETVSRRNAALLLDYRAGERTSFLARKYGISRRRVRQIISETL